MSHSVSLTRKLTVTAVLSAIAFLLMFLEFSLPMLIPGFVKMDLSDLPALLGSFALGPSWGVIIELMKNLLHLLIKGTSSAYVGEICNFLFGAVFVAVAGTIYLFRHNRTGAIVGSLLGALAMALLSVPLNYFLVYPVYAKVFAPMEQIIAAYQSIMPSADSLLKCLVIFNLPFTLVKGLLDVAACWLVYKPLSPVLHGKR